MAPFRAGVKLTPSAPPTTRLRYRQIQPSRLQCRW